METLVELVARIKADASQLKTGLASAEKSVQTFGQSFNKTISGLQAPLNKLSNSMLAIGTAITGIAVLSIKNFADMGSQLTNLSIKTGFSTTALSKLSYMAKLNDTSIEGLEVGIRTLQGTVYDASRGLKTATDSFEAMGLTIADIEGLNPEQQFWAVANALAGVEKQSTRAAIAQDIFGRSGTQLLPILAMGKEGMVAAGDEAERLGIVMDTETAAGASKLDDALTKLKESISGASLKIAAALAPKLVILADKFADVVIKVGEWIDKNPAMIEGILKVGAALLVAGIALKAFAVTLAVVQAFSGPAGWIALGVSIAAAGAAIIAVNEMTKGLFEAPEPAGRMPTAGAFKGGALPWIADIINKAKGTGEPTPGLPGVGGAHYATGGIVTQPTLAMVGEAGPEAIIPLSGGGMGNTTLNFNIGTWMGDEGGIRKLSQTVLTYIREDLRRGVTAGVI